jgi:hypothetical protein
MSSVNLINAYKNAKILISQSPIDKNNIITDYIDLVVKFSNNNYNSQVQRPIINPVSNPSEISIYNNFNNVPTQIKNENENKNQSIQNNKKTPYIDITKTSSRSIQELAATFNYLK